MISSLNAGRVRESVINTELYSNFSEQYAKWNINLGNEITSIT